MAKVDTASKNTTGRGAKPGERRGGRKAGTPNKKTQSVIDRLNELNCDPIEGMAEIASQAMSNGELQLAGAMYKELAQYVAPKRKAIEIENNDAIQAEQMKGLSDNELEIIARGG